MFNNVVGKVVYEINISFVDSYGKTHKVKKLVRCYDEDRVSAMTRILYSNVHGNARKVTMTCDHFKTPPVDYDIGRDWTEWLNE